jgi:hypothetical protein
MKKFKFTFLNEKNCSKMKLKTIDFLDLIIIKNIILQKK